MLGSPILYLKAMRILMFQLSGFYCMTLYQSGSLRNNIGHYSGFYKEPKIMPNTVEIPAPSAVKQLPHRGLAVRLLGLVCRPYAKTVHEQVIIS